MYAYAKKCKIKMIVDNWGKSHQWDNSSVRVVHQESSSSEDPEDRARLRS